MPFSRPPRSRAGGRSGRSEEHTSELQSPCNLVCRLLLEKKICFTMLHHVPSAGMQDRLVSEVASVLRPGAIFAGTDIFFFNYSAPPEIYTLSLHDALPILIPSLKLVAMRITQDAIPGLRDPHGHEF